MSELEGVSDRAKYYETVGQTLADRAGIDPDRYGATYEDIGRQLMTMSGGPLSAPAEQAYSELDEGIAKREILPRINTELIKEHKEHPIGRHSDDLERVLNYFRRQPMEGKYVILETEKFEEFYIGELPGVRGEPPEKLDNPLAGIDEAKDLPYPLKSVEQAEHAVFLRRIKDLQNKFDDS
ncbi:inner-membrane translocator [Halalkalicoccus jeotgali]|nr:inner-membrane translocator [Halalkalicoccus jeotgali]